jgi:type IV pilus assembly protein PilA
MIARIRKSLEKREEGFTLIELLVVIIIIGILAAIAIPVFLSQRTKGYDTQAKSDAKNLSTAEETVLADKGYYADATDATANTDLTTTGGFKKSGSVTSVAVEGLSSATAAIGTANTSTNGYCITVVSKTPKTFYWNSYLGGLTATACP